MTSKSRLPVTIITGFLGSGKTTLLRYLINNSQKRLAIIVNEFGSVGLDGDLIKSCGLCPEDELEGRLIELNNGCLCCTVQDDFLPTMQRLLSLDNNLDGIVIETSGLALPRPLLQALAWPEIRSNVYINGLVTLVDGEALSQGTPIGDIKALEQQRLDDPSLDHLTPINELFKDQLELSDLVLVSRSDIINSEQLDKVLNEITPKIRETTQVIQIKNGEINPDLILGISSEKINADSEEYLVDHDHHHLNIESEIIRAENSVRSEDLITLLVKLVKDYQIIRLKGRCWIKGKSLPLQLQMVGPRIDSWFERVPKSSWNPPMTGIEIVSLSLKSGAGEAIRKGINDLKEI